MKPDVVVDVGNSRIKWGRCACGAVGQVMSLADDPAAWQVLLERWAGLPPSPPEGRGEKEISSR